MLIAALVGAMLIGVSLGLLGSGGSILTVPVLVYLVGQPEKVAIAGSLAIVGAIAAVGALQWARARLVDWRSVVWFGVPGAVGTVAGAWSSQWVSGTSQLVVFALVMLLAAWFMLQPRAPLPPGTPEPAPRTLSKVIADGLAVGALTGFVGVGGGFMIVPALVVLARIDMHRAIGTSLVIIAVKSAAGFAQYLPVLAVEGLSVDWGIIGLFSAVGAAGTVVGNRFSRRVPQTALKRGFGALLVPMALYILWRSLT